MDANAPPQRPSNLCQVADYLLSPQSGLKKRDGVFNDSRVIYFRGNRTIPYTDPRTVRGQPDLLWTVLDVVVTIFC